MPTTVTFAVTGKVQGVFFRKYTKAKADALGVVGSVRNEADGSVSGKLQGAEAAVAAMCTWLRTTGSPKSRIDSCVFRNRSTIAAIEYTDFVIEK